MKTILMTGRFYLQAVKGDELFSGLFRMVSKTIYLYNEILKSKINEQKQ
jgi:hypothetical protein